MSDDDGVYHAADVPVPTMAEVEELVGEIKAVLAGRGPLAQGAALADIVAMYFAGHNPKLREDTIANWTETMLGLITVNEQAIFERYGVPPGWENKQ